MKIDIDIWDDVELDAFGDFLKTIAAYRRINANDKMVGLAPPAERVAELKAEIAAHLKEDEPEPVATPAPAEKKTRPRKAKDAPAVSVSSADAADAAADNYVADVQANPDVPNHAISTGEERIGPEDSPEVVAQDEADEKAESDAARDPGRPLTLDDVRSALGEYVRVYGMAAAQEDGPKVITLVCGEGKVKVSDVPDDKVAAVVSGVKEMSEKNPFKREKVAA